MHQHIAVPDPPLVVEDLEPGLMQVSGQSTDPIGIGVALGDKDIAHVVDHAPSLAIPDGAISDRISTKDGADSSASPDLRPRRVWSLACRAPAIAVADGEHLDLLDP